MRSLLRSLKHTIEGLWHIRDLGFVREQAGYYRRETDRLNAAMRRSEWLARRGHALAAQTKASFDFQWEHIPTGRSLPSDDSFMTGLEPHLLEIVQVPSGWFDGKTVVDVGCGIGRYSYGMLKLGSRVTACDQSEAALRRTAELCSGFRDRLTLRRIDLLDWDDAAEFDLAFSFGVVHHTGNTYLAMENVCRKVRPGGRVFFMIYGVPETLAQFREVNDYERIAAEVRSLSFGQRQASLIERFGSDAAHAWFDATSPRINDRLTFEEIHDVLTELGFAGIRRTVTARNHFVVADRSA